MIWLLCFIPVLIVIEMIVMARTTSRRARGPLADPNVQVRIIRPAFSNAEIALVPVASSTDEDHSSELD